jgi:hypothetical protein
MAVWATRTAQKKIHFSSFLINYTPTTSSDVVFPFQKGLEPKSCRYMFRLPSIDRPPKTLGGEVSGGERKLEVLSSVRSEIFLKKIRKRC